MANGLLNPPELKAPARNRLLGWLADAAGGVYDYAQSPDPTMPMGKANPVLSLLADAVPFQPAVNVLNDWSYGQAPIRGTGMTTRLTPDAAELALTALPFPKTSAKTVAAIGSAGMVPGLDAAMFIGAKAKKLDAAAEAAALATAQRNAAKAINEGGLGLAVDNTAAQRAAALGYEGGFWRGAEAPVNGAPNGPWYTRAGKEEAEDYAARIPEGNRDVREYALPKRNVLAFDRTYPNNLATDLANLVEADGHKKAAKTLRDYYPAGEQISGMEAYKFLQRFVGDGAPESYLSRLGFGQVDGVNSPNYRLVLDQSLVRDASKAAFDPMRLKERNIFAGIGGMGLLGGLLPNRQED